MPICTVPVISCICSPGISSTVGHASVVGRCSSGCAICRDLFVAGPSLMAGDAALSACIGGISDPISTRGWNRLIPPCPWRKRLAN